MSTLRLCRRPTSDLHRILHPSAVPAIGIRLSSALCFPAQPSRRPSACAAGRPSSPAFQLNLRPSSAVAFSCPAFPSTCDLRRLPTLQPCPRTQPPTLIGCCISGSAFRSASDLRRLLTLPPCLRTQPPAFTGCCILRLRLLADLRLAPPIYPPASPSAEKRRLLKFRRVELDLEGRRNCPCLAATL